MAYTVVNFMTKKALKEAVALHQADPNCLDAPAVRCSYHPGLGLDISNYTGKVWLEGPHYPEPHRWYAEAELKDGVVVKVR